MSETPQQRAAIDARGKIIVSASAGSGKTFVMVERIVSLVLDEGLDLSRLIAVTFTNKAAAQMRDRIRRALLEAAAKRPASRECIRAQLRALPLADVCTIHAFCGRLLRTYFYLLDLDPAFRIVGDDDPEFLALSGRAAVKTFEEAYASKSEGFSKLLEVYFRKKKDSRLRDMVLRLYADVRGLADYRGVLSSIASGEEDLFDRAAEVLARDAAERAESILRRLDLLRIAMEEAPPKVASFYVCVRQAAEVVAGERDLFRMRDAIVGISIPNSPRRTGLDDGLAEALGRLQSLSAETKKLLGTIGAYHVRDEEKKLCDSARERAAALAQLTLRYDEALTDIKRENGVLDYSDLEQLACTLLEMPVVRDALHARYSHLFVDEYQDVNPMQERILSLLSGGDVFLVGDKKQAIYGFRGSKSRFFGEKAEAFRTEGESLALSQNFRSARAVLEAVNLTFSAASGDYLPMDGGTLYRDYAGEVLIHPLEPEEKVKRERGVYSVLGAESTASEDPIARAVLRIVERECGRREGLGATCPDLSTGQERSVNYGDIAVLVRKNTKAAGPIVRALSERGIPVTATAEVNICDYFEVRLLIDWLTFLDDPAADIPMASAMLSVLGGFNERELAVIRLRTEEAGDRTSTFRAACEGYLAREEDALSEKLRAFFLRAAHYRALARVRTASEMIVFLLAEGLEAQIAAKGESRERLARVRRLLAESRDQGDTHAFLRRLQNGDFNVQFSEAGGENAVHVLTMHASKGLEFPVVILTELDEDFRRSDYDELLWTEEFHVALRAFDLETRTYEDTLLRKAAVVYEKREQREGERNLLYVAMTRACCRLHLVLEKGWGDDDEFSYRPELAGRLSDFLPKFRLARFIAPKEEDADFSETEREILFRSDLACREALERAVLPYANEAGTRVPVKDSATGLMKKRQGMSEIHYESEEETDGDTMSESRSELLGLGGSFTAETGTAYHAFLEHADFARSAEEELSRMKEEGIFDEETLRLLDISVLREIFAIPYFSTLKGKRTFREQRFLVQFPAREFSEVYRTDAEEQVVFQGAIDLLVEEGEGRYTVVDYKYSSLDDEKLLEKYAVQLKLYRKTVAKVFAVAEDKVGVRILNLARCREIVVR